MQVLSLLLAAAVVDAQVFFNIIYERQIVYCPKFKLFFYPL